MWHQSITMVILFLMLESCYAGGILQQSFYSLRKGYAVQSNRSELGDEKAKSTVHCAQICSHTEGCLAADHDLCAQQCRMFPSFLGYDGGKETGSAVVLYGSCPHEGIRTACE